MSLTGALLAVFVQQWAHSYFQATQERHMPRNRARIRAYYHEGIEKWHLPWVTRAVPTLIHVSLILFFTGLPVFLFNVNRTVFNIVVTWLGLCTGGYACITVMPILSQDTPYFSPLSSSAWWCVTRTLSLVMWLLEGLTRRNSSVFWWYNTYYTNSPLGWPSSMARGMRKLSENTALQLKPGIDYRALFWMFQTLNDDNEFEQFFDALPGLCESIVLEDHQEGFIKPNQDSFSTAIIGLMNRTLSSNLVSEDVKQRRIIICTRALNATSFPRIAPWWILSRVLDDWHRFLGCIEFGLFVQNWQSITLPVTKFYAKCVVSIIISRVREREENWFLLASLHLKMSRSLIQNYYAHDDNILLANIIFIIRQAVESYSQSSESNRSLILDGFSKTLEWICKFDINRTLPELQHEFCGLWNQLIDANHMHRRIRRIFLMTLKSIRRLYLALHEGTPASPTAFTSLTDDDDLVLNDVTSYSKCMIDQHRSVPPVPNLRFVDPPRNTAGNSRRVSVSTTVTATTSASSLVQVSALSSTLAPMPYPPAPATSPLPSTVRAHFNSPLADPQSHFATVPPPRDSTAHIPQIAHTSSTGAQAISESSTQQDPGISLPSSRFTPDAAPGRVEISPSPSPSPASRQPRDSISTHSDSLEEHNRSLQT
jgi:Family of unknown function (DUF6535)